jgi:pimeloyl-ACP methyl ester carboxylesterase
MTEDVEDEGWKEWARILEEVIRPRADRKSAGELSGQPWPRGEVPAGVGVVHVVADGLYSASASHWLDSLAGPIAAAGCIGRSCGYSYKGHGLTYSTEDTGQSLGRSASSLVEYLRVCPDQTVLVGFSLGTVVTLLGTAHWFTEPESSMARAKLKAIVLVAPAHSASPLIARSYEEWFRGAMNASGRRTPRLPSVVRQFASPHSVHRRAAVSAFATIVGQQIPIYVVHWPGDSFTPYVRPDIGPSFAHLLHEIPVLLTQPAGELRSAIGRHIQIRVAPEVLTEVARRVKEAIGQETSHL